MGQSISNFFKKYWLRFVIVILAIMFFLLAHRYFIQNLEKDGRPLDKQLENLQVTNPNDYRSNIEGLSRYDERNYIHSLNGWAFSLETTNKAPEQIETIIVLASNKNKFYFETASIGRPDVVEAFQDLEIEIGEPGFSALINQQLLPADEYCVGILLQHAADPFYQLINTNQVLVRKGWTLELTKENSVDCEKVFTAYEPIIENISLPAITNQINYFVDGLVQVEDRKGSYDLNGWAFSTLDLNQPTNIFKTKIVLFNESKTYVYETTSSNRGDVIEAFKELKIEIVKPGYQTTISAEQLQDVGNYCIGVLLTGNPNVPDQFIVTSKIITKMDSTLELLEEKEAYCQNVYNENINANSN